MWSIRSFGSSFSLGTRTGRRRRRRRRIRYRFLRRWRRRRRRRWSDHDEHEESLWMSVVFSISVVIWVDQSGRVDDACDHCSSHSIMSILFVHDKHQFVSNLDSSCQTPFQRHTDSARSSSRSRSSERIPDVRITKSISPWHILHELWLCSSLSFSLSLSIFSYGGWILCFNSLSFPVVKTKQYSSVVSRFSLWSVPVTLCSVRCLLSTNIYTNIDPMKGREKRCESFGVWSRRATNRNACWRSMRDGRWRS